MRNVKNTIADYLLALVAPHLCFNCGAIGRPLCGNCKSHIICRQSAVCVFCSNVGKNGLCLDHDLPYSALWVVGVRRGPLQSLVGAFKFRYMRAALGDLVDLLRETIPNLPSTTVVVPVPTQAAHVRQRGYDHALLVAEGFAARRHLTFRRVVGRRGVSVQHRLDRAGRIEAAKEAYVAPAAIDPSVPYLIIDDIVTTGATVEAVAKTLRAAGARTVWVAAIAYQPLD